MKPRNLLHPRASAELFDRAVQERALAVLNIQGPAGWETFKSRFLERDPRGRFFVLDYQPVDGAPLPAVVPGQYVGVSFRQRSHKLLFASVVEARGHYVEPDHTQVPAVRYRWPDAITELQRRAYFRTPVPEDVRVAVKLWPGGLPDGDQAQTQPTVSAELADLSCGGALVRCTQPAAGEWHDGQTLGVELQLPDGHPPVRLEARPRGLRPDGEISTVALQFVGLELSPDGATVLHRIAGAVQRFHHMSPAGSGRSWNSRR